ncbi:hypothetical protein RN001_003632 [Aquatica leii]|uniref:Uncharacterized protein n=1 Tax=Aquatica leii TaxID=1421715 RepID=A0AAN7PRC0_9COLE|nr:hypothetical protein RN001_003632 [Aquatica leii]
MTRGLATSLNFRELTVEKHNEGRSMSQIASDLEISKSTRHVNQLNKGNDPKEEIDSVKVSIVNDRSDVREETPRLEREIFVSPEVIPPVATESLDSKVEEREVTVENSENTNSSVEGSECKVTKTTENVLCFCFIRCSVIINMNSSSSSSDSDAVCGIIDQPLLLFRSSSSSDSEVELELIGRLRVLRTFRERPNNYNRWSEQEFFIRFCLQKGTVVHLLVAIENDLVHGTNRNLADTITRGRKC